MGKSRCFNLVELWNLYDEWSAYGVGSPITISGGKTVVQYYTPYLSAIQIYTPTRNSSSLRDGELEVKSWSASESMSSGSSSSSEKIWDVEDLGIHVIDHDHSPERDQSLHVGDLYFQHFEVDGPFGRPPLKDKIDALSVEYPGLKCFNSNDLSPASWMAIAWYPIYHIPNRRNSKQLYASFLTYHKLASPFHQGNININNNNDDDTI